MSFDVILKNPGSSKLGVVKTVIDLTGLGLKDAKDLVDDANNRGGGLVRRTQTIEEAKSVKLALEDAGANVEIMDTKTLEIISSTDIATTSNVATLTFKVLPNGSIEQWTSSTPTGILNYLDFQYGNQQSFRINYRSTDGTDKTEVIEASSLEDAKSKIKDLSHVNYHMGG